MASISPEFWKYLPTKPEFGSLTDFCGGKNGPLDEVDYEPISFQEETSRGLIDCKYFGEKMSVTAVDLGIDLLFGKDGKLDSVTVDIY